jgi:hypothetical protein
MCIDSVHLFLSRFVRVSKWVSLEACWYVWCLFAVLTPRLSLLLELQPLPCPYFLPLLFLLSFPRFFSAVIPSLFFLFFFFLPSIEPSARSLPPVYLRTRSCCSNCASIGPRLPWLMCAP